MGPTPPLALPPVTAEYGTMLQGSQPHIPSTQSAYRFTRASDGKTRVDSGNMSVITDPAAAQTILLDHAKQTAAIQPGPPPPAPALPGMPQMPHFAPPGLPSAPHAPDVKVEDLGKSVLHGHEVEGKRFLIQPPAPPKLPAFAMPGLPKFGKPPAPPQAPPPPQPPSTAEVWTSPSMQIPMLTKVNGGFGQLTQVCHSAVPGEPHPTAFQIPPGYKVTGAAG